MYICICNAVTQNEIKEAAKQGKTTMDLIRKNDEFDRRCGKCSIAVQKELNKYKEGDDDNNR